jgi:hypothetical protein
VATRDLKPFSDISSELDVLCNTDATRKPRSNVKDPIEHISGPVLASECDKVCIPCSLALKKNKIPCHALANGLWIGDIPLELQDLTWMEQKLIACITYNESLVRVHISKMYKIRCNVVCRATPMNKIYNILPLKKSNIEEVLAIMFLGPTSPDKKLFYKTPLLVRHNKVASALEWLKLNHTDYQELHISYENLSKYPEDEPPVYVEYYPSNYERQPEATAVSNTADDDKLLMASLLLLFMD